MRLLFALVSGGALSAGSAAAAAPAPVRQLQVEAAFLVNFIRFTDWPAQGLPPTAPYVLTVVGSDEAASTVSAVSMAAGTIRGHSIEVRHLRYRRGAREPRFGAQLRDSQLVFVQASATSAVKEVIEAVRGAPVLTVSDVPDFTSAGGMLGLFVLGSHLAFEANPAAIRASGLQVSAKVLKLAHIHPGGS